jgi:hypothetical protein
MIVGKWIIYAGLIFVAIGVIVQYAPWAVSWFGKLPGDIRIGTERGHVFIPITSMIIVSLVLTVLVNLLRR